MQTIKRRSGVNKSNTGTKQIWTGVIQLGFFLTVQWPTSFTSLFQMQNQKTLCTDQQATQTAISLIVSRRGCLGSWPWYSWCHCFPLMNADKNSKAILKSSNITHALAFFERLTILLTQTPPKRTPQKPWREPEETSQGRKILHFHRGKHINVWSHKLSNLRLSRFFISMETYCVILMWSRAVTGVGNSILFDQWSFKTLVFICKEFGRKKHFNVVWDGS